MMYFTNKSRVFFRAELYSNQVSVYALAILINVQFQFQNCLWVQELLPHSRECNHLFQVTTEDPVPTYAVDPRM